MATFAKVNIVRLEVGLTGEGEGGGGVGGA